MIVRAQSRGGLEGVGETWAEWCSKPIPLYKAPLAMAVCPFQAPFQRQLLGSLPGFETSDYQAPPSPPAPTIKLTTTPTPDSTYAGQDAAGTDVYAVPETAAENMVRTKSLVDQFFKEQGDRTPPDDFMSKYGSALAIAGAIAGALVLVNVTRGRR